MMLHRYFCRFNAAFLLYILNSVIDKGDSSKILFFNGMGEGSHFAAAAVLGEELASRGHLVTFLISEEFKHHVENPELSAHFEFIVINSGVIMKPYYAQVTQAHFEGSDLYYNKTFLAEIEGARAKECSVVLSSNFLTNLKNRQFDLLVFDPWWPCCIALGQSLGTKRVALNPASVTPEFLRAFGLHVNSAIIAEQGTLFPEKMNFFQRFQNVLISYRIPMSNRVPLNDALATQRDSPLVTLLEKNRINSRLEGLSSIDLFISTSDHLLYPDLPETAGHILVGGLTTKKALPLTEDLETFMQSSGDDGVILFSLGTYVTHLPDKFVALFREVFAKLPQKVIWQWKEGGQPPKVTDNVKLMSWLPQNDLLGHNKTRLLIYQGGNNGLHEAIYHAVPVLVMPLGGDQLDVAQRITEKGIALKVDVTSVTVESLHNAICNILRDPKTTLVKLLKLIIPRKPPPFLHPTSIQSPAIRTPRERTNSWYQTNMNKMSTIFRDYPLSPRHKAAYWIEHILKYGSEHLHSASRELNDWQRNLIDVYAFIFFIPTFCLTAGIMLWMHVSNIPFPLVWFDKSKTD